MNDEFEWDPVKAAANYRKHGVRFEHAQEACEDVFALVELDDSEDYGEDRYAIIGMAEGRLLYVAYAIRGEVIRIISARLAEPRDRRRYHEENET